jgi:hypothetical protein
LKDKGDHGYDNRIREMRALFGAKGPSIRGPKNVLPYPFQNIELYNLFAGLLIFCICCFFAKIFAMFDNYRDRTYQKKVAPKFVSHGGQYLMAYMLHPKAEVGLKRS